MRDDHVTHHDLVLSEPAPVILEVLNRPEQPPQLGDPIPHCLVEPDAEELARRTVETVLALDASPDERAVHGRRVLDRHRVQHPPQNLLAVAMPGSHLLEGRVDEGDGGRDLHPLTQTDPKVK